MLSKRLRRVTLLLAVLLVSVNLANCGRKGDLYLPEQEEKPESKKE